MPPTQPQTPQPPATEKKKPRIPKFVKVLIGVGVALIAIALVVIFVVLPGVMKSAGNSDYYEIANDKVPSVRFVLDEDRKVTGVNTAVDAAGIRRKQFTYEASENVREDLSLYVTYLMEKDGFKAITDFNLSAVTGKDIQVARNSKTKGYMVVMQLDYNEKGYVITLMYGKGEVTDNETVDTSAKPNDDSGGSVGSGGLSKPDNTNTTPVETPSGGNQQFNGSVGGGDVGGGGAAGPQSYSVQDESIPSISAVLGGTRTVIDSSSGMTNGVTSVTVKYSVPGTRQGLELNEYRIYLEKNESFYLLTSVDFAQVSGSGVLMAKSAAKAGYIVLVELEWNNEGYTIKTSYMEGTVTPNEQPGGAGGVSELPPLLRVMSSGVFWFMYTANFEGTDVMIMISQDGDMYASFMTYSYDGVDYMNRTVIRDGYTYTIDMTEQIIIKNASTASDMEMLDNDYSSFSVLDSGTKMLDGINMQYIEYGDGEGESYGTYYILNGEVHAIELEDGSIMYIGFYDDVVEESMFEIPEGFQVIEG